jgi:ubiquitin-conjugating enzyme E2 D/E
VLDGARFRDTSKSWAQLKAEAIADGHTGYSDGYDTCMKKATDALKAKLTERLLNDGSNLIIPDTCSNAKSVIKKANMLRTAGYTLDVLVVVAPKTVCVRRGTSREQFEGKKYSCKNWKKSMESVEVVINHMRDENLSEAEFVIVDSGGDNGKDRPPTVVLNLGAKRRIKGQVLADGQLIRFTALMPSRSSAQAVAKITRNSAHDAHVRAKAMIHDTNHQRSAREQRMIAVHSAITIQSLFRQILAKRAINVKVQAVVTLQGGQASSSAGGNIEQGKGHAQKRLAQELDRLTSEPPEGCHVMPGEAGTWPVVWHVFILGPEQTPYADAVFKLDVVFSANYPFEPPTLTFKTAIYHCNVAENGRVCCEQLREKWCPSLSLEVVLIGIVSLLKSPHPELEEVERKSVATEFLSRRDEHDRKALECTKASQYI